MSKEIIILLLIWLVIASKFEIIFLNKKIQSTSERLELTENLYKEQRNIIHNILKNE